ncbi:uncharacterized protein LOC114319185 [Camellia sinensis]|uniref:uncharacterized protein LOC114319185 n=1 Tax=Camellia sinensis TaxID=4442 RepID=UPI0010355531|nr:uncharacterized protein LOC114319185 [Camellia sinensis]
MSCPCCNQPVASGDEHIVIPVASDLEDEWLESIMSEGESSSSHKKLPKVPEMLQQMESIKKCYKPEVVSIGPYHHNKAKLKSFEKLKIRFTKEYVNSYKPESSATALYKQVAVVAGEARNCYAEDATKSFNDRDFTRMMFLDGCFVLQYIHYKNDEEEETKMTMKNHEKAFVQRDLFLLENQLPFIVLQALMTMNSEFAGKKGLELINKFIQNTRPSPPLHNSFWELVENCITSITNRLPFQKNITNRHKEKSKKSNSQLDKPAHLLELKHKQPIEPKAFRAEKEWNTSKYLGSDEEVTGLFNEIAKNLVPNPVAYKDVRDQIENHYKNKFGCGCGCSPFGKEVAFGLLC